MSDEGHVLTDTRDMFGIHEAFRRALGDARGQIESVPDGDTARALRFSSYLSELLWLLHAHHDGEDELLYPMLAERVPEERELLSRMAIEHRAVAENVQSAERATETFGITGSAADGQALAASCELLLGVLSEHLAEEEFELLPIAARHISPPEWGALPGHAMSRYSGTRMWLPFGLAMEAMPEDIASGIRDHLPPPVAQMWFGGGSDAFMMEMNSIRGGSS